MSKSEEYLKISKEIVNNVGGMDKGWYQDSG